MRRCIFVAIICFIHLAGPDRAESLDRLMEKAIDPAEILSVPANAFQVIPVNGDAVFEKISPLRKEISASGRFFKSLWESLGIKDSQNRWISELPFFSLMPTRGEQEITLYLRFQLPKVPAKKIRQASLLVFGPSIQELELTEGQGYEETLVKLMNSVNLRVSSQIHWREEPRSSLQAEEQYLQIKPEADLGSPTISSVYSGCYFWDVTQIIHSDLPRKGAVTFLIRNENTDLGYGVNIFSSKMHRLWPKRMDKSPRLVLEWE